MPALSICVRALLCRAAGFGSGRVSSQRFVRAEPPPTTVDAGVAAIAADGWHGKRHAQRCAGAVTGRQRERSQQSRHCPAHGRTRSTGAVSGLLQQCAGCTGAVAHHAVASNSPRPPCAVTATASQRSAGLAFLCAAFSLPNNSHAHDQIRQSLWLRTSMRARSRSEAAGLRIFKIVRLVETFALSGRLEDKTEQFLGELARACGPQTITRHRGAISACGRRCGTRCTAPTDHESAQAQTDCCGQQPGWPGSKKPIRIVSRALGLRLKGRTMGAE